MSTERGLALGRQLFAYDRRLAANALRNSAAGLRDRLTIVAAALIGGGVLHAWFVDRSWRAAIAVAAAGGALAGLAVGRWVTARLRYHATDGALAANALVTGSARHYAAMWYLVGAALLVVVALIARPSLAIASMPGYAAGALASFVTSRVRISFVPGVRVSGRGVSALLRDRRGGLAAAASLLILLTLGASLVPPIAVPIVAFIAAGVLVLAVTTVDDALVRFMAIAGFGNWATIGRHLRGAATLLAIGAPVVAIGFGGPAGAGVAAAALLGMVLLVVRVLAYRRYPRRAADTLIVALIGVVALTGVAAPILLPLLLALIVWALHRRAQGCTWQVA